MTSVSSFEVHHFMKMFIKIRRLGGTSVSVDLTVGGTGVGVT